MLTRMKSAEGIIVNPKSDWKEFSTRMSFSDPGWQCELPHRRAETELMNGTSCRVLLNTAIFRVVDQGRGLIFSISDYVCHLTDVKDVSACSH